MKYQLIDLSWTMYRSHHTLGHLTATVNGITKPTGHIYGVLTDVERALKRGYRVVICPDGIPKGIDLNPLYKAGRNHPDYNIMQDKEVTLYEALKHPLVRVVHNPNLEADEIIAELSRRYSRKGHEVEILSGDDDLLQSLSERVTIRRGPTEDDVITLEKYHSSDKYKKKYRNVPPDQLPKFRALVGDKSDNLRGIDRIPRDLVVRLIKTIDLTSPEAIRKTASTVVVKESQRKYIDTLIQEAERININYRIMNLNKEHTLYQYRPSQKDTKEYQLTRWWKYLEEVT